MAEPFIGEIRPFPYTFAPRGWAFCQGQILPIAQNTALFSLLGTTYGGNGQTTFALPDLQGRCALSAGQGPGLSSYDLGQRAGAPAISLQSSQIPAHNHLLGVTPSVATSTDPVGNLPALSTRPAYLSPGNGLLAPGALANTGGSQPHNNQMPFLGIGYCIALVGIFPSRN